MQHSQTAGVQTLNFISFNYGLLIKRFRDSHISMGISCNSTRLNKSSSDWLKSREVGNSIIVKKCDFCVLLFHKVVQRHYLCEVGK